MSQQIGFIGLGRMGFHMVERLLKHKINVVAYNRSLDKVKQIVRKGARGAKTVEELIQMLPGKKKIVWLMLPAGRITEKMIKNLLPLLKKGDIIIDGANEFYKVAEKYRKMCDKYGVHYFDCGVSGGIWGLKNGYTLMIGGERRQFKIIEPYCKALAPRGGYGYFGETGSGFFVKSVHNIVEYIYLQGLAEGTEILSKFKYPIDLVKATSVWGPASVVRSWLLDLTNIALKRPDFKKILPKIDSITIEELIDTKKALKGFTPALDVAIKTRRDESKKFIFGKRIIAAVRREFGGHGIKEKNSK